jgi:membrane protease YdiL (CAAX protease family)
MRAVPRSANTANQRSRDAHEVAVESDGRAELIQRSRFMPTASEPIASTVSRRAAVAELVFVALLAASDFFSPTRLVLLLLVASASLWNRHLGWSHVGLRRPPRVGRTLAIAIVGAVVILGAVPTIIVPLSTWVSQRPVDLSALGNLRQSTTMWMLLAQVWTLAAFGEEMAFRGYVMRRVMNIVGVTPPGLVVAVAISSVLFGLAHGYQGVAGMIATGLIGVLVALVYLCDRQNLWAAIICHGVVDSVSLALIYFGHESLLFPRGRLTL